MKNLNLANTIRIIGSWATFGNKRRSSANGSNTSSVGAVTSLILVATFGLVGANNVFAANSTLNMSIDNATLELNITPTSANGSFAKSSNSTISVTTNNYSGYTLSIAASSSTNLVGTNGNITSISSAVSESDFSADNTTAATNYNGKWGYKPQKYNSTSNSNFLPSPGTGSNSHTLNITNCANNTTNCPNTTDTYTLAIGARVSNSTAPGSYSNTFVVTAVANLINYTITYNKGNTTDTVTGLPTNTTGTISNPLADSTNITLSSTEPARDGYNFLGWCTVLPTAGTNGAADTCSGTTIGAGGTYNLNAAANPAVTLYAIWEEKPKVLYDMVAAMSKGKNTDSSSGFSWTSITKGTSGVYEWDGKTAGNGVDSNGGSEKIYFYRGILDTTTGSYGSDGDAAAYPNYVRLANNTCWRIVRTTSTRGVKMIYNGIYGDTTAGSCANATAKAQTRYDNANLTVPFNTSSITRAGKTYTGLQYKNIHAVGYTYTSSVAASTTSTRTPAQLFGASPNGFSTNDKSSIMKQYIEDWYASNMTAYTSILEGDAGYCQDRRLNTSTTWTSPLSESSNTIVPYGTSSMTQYYFGAYPRNTQSSTFNPLLTCPRGKVDLYSYTGDAGNGNGQLTYPVALLTADEVSLAGSGWSNSLSAYNSNSYLRSGSYFWLLSPSFRGSNGSAYGFDLSSNGNLYDLGDVGGTRGVRPAISLTSGTTAASGSGTATDPWVITAP